MCDLLYQCNGDRLDESEPRTEKYTTTGKLTEVGGKGSKERAGNHENVGDAKAPEPTPSVSDVCSAKGNNETGDRKSSSDDAQFTARRGMKVSTGQHGSMWHLCAGHDSLGKPRNDL